MDKTLIFLHIHKTAGTSLKHFIMRHFPARAIHEMDQEYFRLQVALDDLAALDVDARRRIDCLIGHVAYGVHALLPREPAYVTMLRDPVARTLSHYYYVRNSATYLLRERTSEKVRLTVKEQAALHERRYREDLQREIASSGTSAVAPETLALYEQRLRAYTRPEDTPENSLEAFLDMSVDAQSLNLQTRMIGGFVPYGHFVPPFPPLPPDALDTAKRNLRDNIAVCGLVERFDESIVLLRSVFGWQGAHYERENVGRRRSQAPPAAAATLRRIERHCELDRALYEYAGALLTQRLRELPDFAASLRQIRRGQRRYDLYHGLRGAYDRAGLQQFKALALRILGR